MSLSTRILITIASVVTILILAGFALTRCQSQITTPLMPFATLRPILQPTPQPAQQPTPAVAQPSPEVIAVNQNAHVIITRGASTQPVASEVIDITINQVGSAVIPMPDISAPPSPSVPISLPVNNDQYPGDDHTRLGIFAGTFPGIVAIDIQIVRLYPLQPLGDVGLLPDDLARMEMGMDTEINLKQAGILLTAGGRIYAGVGFYGSLDLSYGFMAGVGCRF